MEFTFQVKTAYFLTQQAVHLLVHFKFLRVYTPSLHFSNLLTSLTYFEIDYSKAEVVTDLLLFQIGLFSKTKTNDLI